MTGRPAPSGLTGRTLRPGDRVVITLAKEGGDLVTELVGQPGTVQRPGTNSTSVLIDGASLPVLIPTSQVRKL